MRQKHIVVTLTLIMLAAAAIRVVRIGRESFWFDEMATVEIVTAPDMHAFLERMLNFDPGKPPLYYLALRAWTPLFGESEAAYRLFSALLGVLTIPFVYALGREMFSVKAGLYGAAIFAASFANVKMSHEARHYTMLVLFTTASFLFLYRLSYRKRTRDSIFYVLSLAAGLYTHFLFGFIIAAHNVIFLLAYKRLGIRLVRWLLLQAAAWMLFLPWIAIYLRQMKSLLTGSHFAYIEPPTIKMVAATIIGYIGGDSITTALLLLVCLVAVFRIGWATGEGKKHEATPGSKWSMDRYFDALFECLVLVSWLGVPLVAIFLFSKYGKPILGPGRYTVFLAPAYYLLIARGAEKLKYAGVLVVLLAIVLTLAPLGQLYTEYSKPQWRQMAAIARRETVKGTLLLYPWRNGWEVRHYFAVDWYRHLPYREDNSEELAKTHLAKETGFLAEIPLCSFDLSPAHLAKGGGLLVIVKNGSPSPVTTLVDDEHFRNLMPGSEIYSLYQYRIEPGPG